MIREGLAVGAGAALGAVARFLLLEGLGDSAWVVLGVNALACLLMGLFLPGVFWGKGVLGGFSTFSTFAAFLAGSTAPVALFHALTTMLMCVGAYLVGLFARERRREAFR
ncbi:CrcB family protein [Corynebacterium guangdongense]|uniref:Fluoride-specific ion channel n=1 Tax=Corynebacterium guangdongense TaxID=1783348 RepID=A0ABU1ZZ32_9CORY|nr:CrcB family protein [Corynebacterium guangdongense]MDR7330196.1 CrcB protein [Corynebacterium guangdongense]WJZ18754.1 camphor resistance protein CrcB [Corynebacterium guangdongense]